MRDEMTADDGREPGGDEAYGSWSGLEEYRRVAASGGDPVDFAIRLTVPLAGPFARRFRDPVFDAWIGAVYSVLRDWRRRERLRAERLTQLRHFKHGRRVLSRT